MATSFAMVLDVSVDDVFNYTGHDGSAIAFPSLVDPHCRRGHTTYEMVQYALTKGVAVVPFQPMYSHVSLVSGEELTVRANPKVIDELFAQTDMVLLGTMQNGSGHAATWSHEHQTLFDPNGVRFSRDKYPMTVELMLLCLPLKQPLMLSEQHENIQPLNGLTS